MQPRSHGTADLQLVHSPALLEGERSVQNRAGKCISTGQGVKTEDEVLRSPGPPEMHFCAILVRLVLMMLILPRADDGRLTARRGLQRLCRSSAGSRIAPRAPPGPRGLPARRCSPDASLLARCCSSDAERRVCSLVRFFSGSHACHFRHSCHPLIPLPARCCSSDAGPRVYLARFVMN